MKKTPDVKIHERTKSNEIRNEEPGHQLTNGDEFRQFSLQASGDGA